MEKEKKTTEVATEAAQAVKTPAVAKATEKKPVTRLSMRDALIRAAYQGKSFDLLQSYYRSKRDNKLYYSYSVFIILPGSAQPFVEVTLVPDSGYFGKDEKNIDIKQTARNSASYGLMNTMYDQGNGLSLELRAVPYKNSLGVEDIRFQYVAVAYDENGIGVECPMKLQNIGAEGYLRAGFIGFGNNRGFVASDLDTVPGLKEAFEKMRMPGEILDVEVESDAE